MECDGASVGLLERGGFFFLGGGGGGGGIAYIREWKTMLPAEEPLYGHTHRTDFKRVSRLTL